VTTAAETLPGTPERDTITTVDAEVHCAPASMQTLQPYLSNYWRNYIADGEIALTSMRRSYPAHAATTHSPDPCTVEELRTAWPHDDGTVGILACTTSFGANRNPYYEAAFTRAINDWMRNEWLDHDGRLRGSMVVPGMNVDAAVEEIERLAADRRFVQVLLPVRGHDVRWGNIRFRRIFQAAARHHLVVALHAWGRPTSAPTPTGFTHHYQEDYLSNSQITVQAQVVSLITEGVFDELPDLRIALLECGFSWIPGLLWRFDKDWKALWREVPWLTQRPTEYLYRHFRASTAPAALPSQPEHIRRMLDILRARELLLYGSDFPHHHGDGTDRLLRALDEPARADVTRNNAIDFYRMS
jgi:predicted TIM-barrel fold metal-dependent hydrolase